MTTHSGIVARKILWTVESGGLQSMESHRVRHYRAIEHARTHTHTHTHTHAHPECYIFLPSRQPKIFVLIFRIRNRKRD